MMAMRKSSQRRPSCPFAKIRMRSVAWNITAGGMLPDQDQELDIYLD